MTMNRPTGPRTIALVGPYLSGKTSLLESILWVTGGLARRGTVVDGTSFGDASPEAREHRMSTEANVATVEYLDDRFTFVDCPGSIELFQEALNVLVGADACVVVAEPDADKALALAPVMRAAEELGVPRILFVNKLDKATGNVEDLLAALAPVSAAPLLLRHMPLVEDERVRGYIDLASERTYVYRDDAPSEIVEAPADAADLATLARERMLETLADFDDALMEKILEDQAPERDEVYRNLTADFQDGRIVPVLIGAAAHDNGVRRLLKLLRHEAPAAGVAATRVGAGTGGAVAQVLKTSITQHAGRMSIARVWSGTLRDGMTLNGQRLGGMVRMTAAGPQKVAEAAAGEVVGLQRLEEARTGDVLSDGRPPKLRRAPTLPPVYELAIRPTRREDEVKLSGALARLVEEDPSLAVEHREATHELVLLGQGDIHLKLALERMQSRSGLRIETSRPQVPYKETIRKSVQQHGRFKRQSGGHGQFGDVHLEIKPLPRGSGFHFGERVVGGSVPRNFIPAVETGVRDYLARGPLGFPVVDIAVELYDGQHHAVDSSEMSFKQAARVTMVEAMPKCDPVLLEPVLHVDIVVPSAYTARANQVVSQRRGHILGFDVREGWPGWDVVQAEMPQAEIHDLIIELRSMTQGAGTYTCRFDHLQEITGRVADQVVEQAKAAAG